MKLGNIIIIGAAIVGVGALIRRMRPDLVRQLVEEWGEGGVTYRLIAELPHSQTVGFAGPATRYYLTANPTSGGQISMWGPFETPEEAKSARKK